MRFPLVFSPSPSLRALSDRARCEQAPPPLQDFAKIQSGWSPNREDRPRKVGEMGKVMGGACILNSSGAPATVAFCFEDEERTGVFGLSVAHLVHQIG